jgi:hypothetical protein
VCVDDCWCYVEAEVVLLKLCAPYGWGGGYLALCCVVAGLLFICILLCDSNEEDGNYSEDMHVVNDSTRYILYTVI